MRSIVHNPRVQRDSATSILLAPAHSCGRDRPVVLVTSLWPACHELNVNDDLPCKGDDAQKYHNQFSSGFVGYGATKAIIPSIIKIQVNEDDIEELVMGHEDELTIELQEILNEEHQETQRNVSPSVREEDERGLMPTSATKDLLKKWEAARAMVLEWHPNQADVSRVRDLYNDNAINYFWENPEKERKAIDIGHVLQRPISKK
ncbi:uncharacterized protein TNCV_2978501 [Trichonephila clavipes]|nr:uncharacterized protein TNCV_2978501 [Trichonephila clavipes]